MKKQYLKTIGSTLIVGAFLFLAFGSDDSSKSSSSSSSSGSSSSSSSSSSESSSSYGSKTCSWCGKSFSGTHYTHLGKLADCQSSTSSNSIGKYCSMKCCSEARRSSCPTCR